LLRNVLGLNIFTDIKITEKNLIAYTIYFLPIFGNLSVILDFAATAATGH